MGHLTEAERKAIETDQKAATYAPQPAGRGRGWEIVSTACAAPVAATPAPAPGPADGGHRMKLGKAGEELQLVSTAPQEKAQKVQCAPRRPQRRREAPQWMCGA